MATGGEETSSLRASGFMPVLVHMHFQRHVLLGLMALGGVDSRIGAPGPAAREAPV